MDLSLLPTWKTKHHYHQASEVTINMAASGEPTWYRNSRADGDIVVSEPPKLDLELHIANYTGNHVLRLS